ncbi:dihydroxyacetone kinase phosphoryl donor subunit DhaM [Mycolicibacterium sp.]|uniref:dihydroxyacetone kinase phosphoryl donor subunit DhaM n=1 Tax=Mycolicibacterium sp. TaxID=2320850 RepID=UPI0025D4628A|nr:dihydroxyacetone kinase phosphoryl donor subunit DhaM [Mycolicibacterium sp.]MCB9409446.1 HPr family phosphocarrier protein [Mycolicibacterium sp.]
MSVGLVVVSHSRPLARAAVALAQEMIRGHDVPIAVAAGHDEDTFGTDAVQISEAIAAADHGRGVVVLMDLGSAVLSSELALELLDEEVRDRVVLCPAPLVEGLVVAAVTAAGGADAAGVAERASEALAAKVAALQPKAPSVAVGDHADETDSSTGFLVGGVTVSAEHGLHVRPAARLVQEVTAHGVHAELRNRTRNSAWVPATSLTDVMALDARRGDELELRVWGPRAPEVLGGVADLADREFR